MPFLYLRDPLFLTVFWLYWINRFLIKNVSHPQFFDSYFNDLICIPFLVPILLFIARKFKARRADSPPQLIEVVIPVVVWSILFEIIFPQHPVWSKWVTGDPLDIVFYTTGGCLALWFWEWWYAPRMSLQEKVEFNR